MLGTDAQGILFVNVNFISFTLPPGQNGILKFKRRILGLGKI